MKCPECGVWITKVKETRNRLDNTTRRAYECGNLHRFNTVERVEKITWGGARPRKKREEDDE